MYPEPKVINTFHNQSKKEDFDQELIQSNTSFDPEHIWKSDKNTRKRHIQEIKAVRPFPQVATRLQGTEKAIWQTKT